VGRNAEPRWNQISVVANQIAAPLVAGQYQLAMTISVPYHRIEGGVRILALSNPQCYRKVIDGLKSLDRWHAEPLRAEGFEKNPGHILMTNVLKTTPPGLWRFLGFGDDCSRQYQSIAFYGKLTWSPEEDNFLLVATSPQYGS
jgi:hypothetical protein